MKSDIFNLGNGNGYSVKEVMHAAEKITGKNIKVKISPRRPGDPSRLVASSVKAQKILGWKPKAGLEEIIKSAWGWEKQVYKLIANGSWLVKEVKV
jgi:UDP-glucose 4-epimerase